MHIPTFTVYIYIKTIHFILGGLNLYFNLRSEAIFNQISLTGCFRPSQLPLPDVRPGAGRDLGRRRAGVRRHQHHRPQEQHFSLFLKFKGRVDGVRDKISTSPNSSVLGQLLLTQGLMGQDFNLQLSKVSADYCF